MVARRSSVFSPLVLGAASLALLGACVAGSSEPVAGAEQAATATTARLPAYDFALAARASEDPGDPVGAFLVPPGSAMKNASPSLNERGEVAIDLLAPDGTEHVFAGGRVVYDVADPKAVISGTSITADGDVAFDVFGGETGNGVFVYRRASNTTSFFSSEPLGAESWINVRLLPSGKIGCRPGAGDRRYLGFVDEKGFTKLAVETATSPSSKYTYLFSPQFDRRDRAAAKVWLASGGNEIRIFALGATPIVVAQDRAANPASPYAALDNGVGFNDRGEVAFVAKSSAGRGVFRTDGTTSRTIALEGQDGVAEIAYFTPVLNDAGLVAFKGMDQGGRNAIWIGDGASLRKVVTAGDALPSDKGSASPLPETGYDPSNRVAFGGGLAINARGQIAFLAALADASGTIRLGTALYVATPR